MHQLHIYDPGQDAMALDNLDDIGGNNQIGSMNAPRPQLKDLARELVW